MSDKDDLKDTPDDDDDWMSYANAGFGSTDYSLWDDAGEEAEIVAEPDWKMRIYNLIQGRRKYRLLQSQLGSSIWLE